MTNLEIIKYLATNNPTRLVELLKSIYFSGFNSGVWERLEDVPDFEDWICADPTGCALYDNEELEEWTEVINPISTLEVFYGSKSKIIDQAIDEIGLLKH